MPLKQKGFTLIELMIVVAIIGVLAAIALPQYQAHVVKTQAARVMSEAGELKTTVEDCLNNGKTTVGVTLADCDPPATGSSLIVGAAQGSAVLNVGFGVPQISINAGNTATIQATIGASAASILDAQTLTWSRDSSGTWTCTTTIPPQYKPRGC